MKRGKIMKITRNYLKKLSVIFLLLLIIVSSLPQTAFGKAYDPEEHFKNLEIRFWEDKKPDIGFYINAASRYICKRQISHTF